MIVVDASVLANVVGDDEDDGHTARRELRAAGELAAPDLVDVETVAVLRKRWLAKAITDERFADAVTDLQRLDFERVPTLRLATPPGGNTPDGPAVLRCAGTGLPLDPRIR